MHSGKAFLEPAMSRPNLHVLIENTVTRLIQTKTTNGLPSFMKVEFARDALCELLSISICAMMLAEQRC